MEYTFPQSNVIIGGGNAPDTNRSTRHPTHYPGCYLVGADKLHIASTAHDDSSGYCRRYRRADSDQRSLSCLGVRWIVMEIKNTPGANLGLSQGTMDGVYR